MPRKGRTPPVLWERVGKYTNRLKVPGGWLVKVTQMFRNTSPQTMITFIVDPKHNWIPEPPVVEKEEEDDDES